MWVIGDVHGCIKTLEALLAQLPSDEPKVLTGDLIDRGPDSKAVVELVIREGIKSVLGNHDLYLLSVLTDDHRFYCPWDNTRGLWINHNGGYATMKSYNDSVPTEHLEWFKSLPLYLKFPEVKNERGQKLFVSHAAHVYTVLPKKDSRIWEESSIVWSRSTARKSKAHFFVYGHTPVIEPVITEHRANIDTGCVYHGAKYKDYSTGVKVIKRVEGYLTALRFPDMKVMKQLCIDEVHHE
jgi:serine/threonine protein phosphatase 1